MRNLEEDQTVSLENPDAIRTDETIDEAVDPVGLVCEYDFGWDKRGNGFSYDSRSGRGSVVGHETGKIIAWEVKSTACTMCDRGHSPVDHACRKNHSGSSKSMEPASAVSLLVHNKAFEECDVRTEVLVGDEDAATIAHVQKASSHQIEKWSDKNHVLKKFTSKLYGAAKRHNCLKGSETIKYLKTLFSLAISQNAGDPRGLENSLRNIVNHTFGEHGSCGEWCRARGDPNYIFKHLPNGKPFFSDTWRLELTEILDVYVREAEKIAPCGSSQRNESFNHMVNTRAPKSRLYAGSSALNYRVAAAVLQKNDGASHILKVNQKLGLSPGKLTKKYRDMLEQKRRKKSIRQKTDNFKRRRLFNKSKNGLNHRKERSEGYMYSSGMADTMERAIAATSESNAVILSDTVIENSCKIVFVDTETTGFGVSADIVQIAALCNGAQFSVHMMPRQNFHQMASEKTGLTCDGNNLYYRGTPIEAVSSADGALRFLEYIEQLQSQILLVGHNIINFDAPKIFSWLKEHSLDENFIKICYGLADTIPLVREGKVAKLETLARKYLTTPEWICTIDRAHDALADCFLLEGLIRHLNISDDNLKQRAVSLKAFFEHQMKLARKRSNLLLLQPLEGFVSKMILSKMSMQGVSLDDLKKEFQSHGRKGIAVCLGVSINNKPRVTKNERIINHITNRVEQLVNLDHPQRSSQDNVSRNDCFDNSCINSIDSSVPSPG